MPNHQLVQFNLSKLKAPQSDPLVKDFFDNILKVNAEGDQSPGFVWRLQSNSGYSSDIPFMDDPLIVINLTVWETVDDLKAFAYHNPAHRAMMKKRNEWFVAHNELSFPPVVLWWIKAGHIPDLEEAKQKLELLKEKGATKEAFTFLDFFSV